MFLYIVSFFQVKKVFGTFFTIFIPTGSRTNYYPSGFLFVQGFYLFSSRKSTYSSCFGKRIIFIYLYSRGILLVWTLIRTSPSLLYLSNPPGVASMRSWRVILNLETSIWCRRTVRGVAVIYKVPLQHYKSYKYPTMRSAAIISRLLKQVSENSGCFQ